MAQTHHSSMETILSVISCSTEEFWRVYDGPYQTDDLAKTVMNNVVKRCEQALQAANARYSLDKFLYGMINEAPHPDGKRYVAATLQVAYSSTRGETAVVAVAESWMETLFLTMLAASRFEKSDVDWERIRPPGGHSHDRGKSTIEVLHPVNTESDLAVRVGDREQHICPITKALDFKYFQSHPLPKSNSPRCDMAYVYIAHVIPLVFKDISPQEPDAQPPNHFRSFFEAWTQLDQNDLTPQKMNSPANAILLSDIQYAEFTKFFLYFDKQAVPDSPNKYLVKARLRSSHSPEYVEFRTCGESSVEPPDSSFVNVHASFSKVFSQSGAAEYFLDLDCQADYDSESDLPSLMNSDDSVVLLKYKLAALAL